MNIVKQLLRFFLLTFVLLTAGCGGGSGDEVDVGQDFTPVPLPRPQTPLLIAQFDSYEGRIDTILQVDELFGILANDEYPVFDTTIEYPLFTVQGGDLEGYQNGSFEYEPPAGFSGQDSFTYVLRDRLGRISSAQVYIQVRPANFRATPKAN